MFNNLVQYAQGNGYNAISKVRANSNGYKYVTFIDTVNPAVAENIYFATAASQLVQVDDVVKATDWFTTEVINAAGEKRTKITNKNGDAEATLIAAGYSKLF